MIRAASLVAFACGIAAADPVVLPKTKAVLDVPPSWSKLPADPALVIAYKSPSGLVLAVTRGQVPNASAWIPASKAAYVAEIEKGALAALPGAKKLASKLSDVGGIPAFDLELRRSDGSTIVTRILLYRTYAIAATVEVPAGGAVAEARQITARFAAPKS